MPVPIPGPEVGSDSLKVKFLMISGRPKTGFLDQFRVFWGTFPQFPLATDHAVMTPVILGWGWPPKQKGSRSVPMELSLVEISGGGLMNRLLKRNRLLIYPPGPPVVLAGSPRGP